tara:strand:+ start:12387 stop:13196 length:810 start_codon:yes stop_codon:yes gene_type:complete
MSKELEEKKSNGITTFDASILIDDAGVGQETMSRDDYMIPRLQVLQSLSPQVNKRDGSYVEGAEAGFIYNTVTQEAYDGEKGIVVVPVSYRRAYIEWKPRGSGGGLVNDHGSDSSILKNCTQDSESYRDVTAEGNEIVTTAEYYVYIVDVETGVYNQALLSMSSSQLKKSKRWNSMIAQLQVPNPKGGTFNPACFYNAYTLTTVPEENDKGSWFGWQVDQKYDAQSGGIIKNIPQGDQIYLAARTFREQIQSGNVKVSPDSVNETEENF